MKLQQSSRGFIAKIDNESDFQEENSVVAVNPNLLKSQKSNTTNAKSKHRFNYK